MWGCVGRCGAGSDCVERCRAVSGGVGHVGLDRAESGCVQGGVRCGGGGIGSVSGGVGRFRVVSRGVRSYGVMQIGAVGCRIVSGGVG